jgi:YVTN family beta-propeller protein
MRNFVLICLIWIAWGSLCQGQQPLDEQIVDDSRLPTGQRVQPAGEWVAFNGRPVDLALSHDGKFVLAKDRSALRVIDRKTMKLIQTVDSPGGASLYGLVVARSGEVLFSNSQNGVHVFSPTNDPTNGFGYELTRTLTLPADSFPCGLGLSDDEQTLYVCLSKKNAVAVVDFATGKLIRSINVGVAPFDVLVDKQRLVVSNIGGRRPQPDDKTADSGGTQTVVDDRGIASTGTVSLIELPLPAGDPSVHEIEVGRHPSVLSRSLNDGSVVVCNTNEDSISEIDAIEFSSTQHQVKPENDIPFGSMPSAIIDWKSEQKYLVALAGNNCLAVVKPNGAHRTVIGLVPTAWYPVALAMDKTHAYVACVKGIGSRSIVRDATQGKNSHDHRGTVQKIRLDQILEADQLETWTQLSLKNARVPRGITRVENETASEAKPTAVAPVPVPKKLGDPSVFKHVIYVIKENRTFDQVFGDLKEARSEPSLCVFPENVTPNHHALARRFGILDNYYCNGVLSADGHSWATEGNVTPYLERAFGGFARSYTFGNDPITYSSSGFLWDHFLDAGFSFRNYGEMDYAKPPAGMKYQEIWKAYQDKQPIEFGQNIGIERVRQYSCRNYPGWGMMIPDVLRMDRFLEEFREFEKNGELPTLCLVYLPQDHLGGGITTRSHMADNDLALGRLVEAVSRGRYWQDTVIFVNEDDPQNGYDHIDGHRSLCLPISAYSKPGVNHKFYNQTSVLRTMLHMFGLPPMNQQDAAAPLMTECFQAEPNLDAFTALAANFPLNEAPQSQQKQSASERKWRGILATVPLERTGMKTEQDEENLNRFVWHDMKGWEAPYPSQWAGPHAKGLKQLGLDLDPDAENDTP